MNIALLFNSGHPSLESGYGSCVMERILGTRVLQDARRYMRVSVGDVLTDFAVTKSRTRTRSESIKLCDSVYRAKEFDRLVRNRLETTYGRATVFCWLFQNMTVEIAEALNSNLLPDPAYLGAMDVDFSNSVHLQLFRNSLPEIYRLYGKNCSTFYSMGENEDPDVVTHEIFTRHGFVVDYEDTGARRTIFDNYDTPEHFTRIQDFTRVFQSMAGLSLDRVSDLVLMLEEVHPKLFDAFASAARTLERAETEEDLAQAALSGRRLLERVADCLFPAQEPDWNGRKVGRAQYKNRLWAYIQQTITEVSLTDATVLPRLGKEADRLVELFNSGLHANPTREKVQEAFRDFVLWLAQVIDLSPKHARRAYLAYEGELDKFFRNVMGNQPKGTGNE